MVRQVIVSLFAGMSLVSEAWAQQQGTSEGWSVTLGGGALFAPTYTGDDDYRLSIVPNVEVRHGERFFASVQTGVGYRWINSPDVVAGPIARVAFPRQEDGNQTFAVSGDDTADLRGLGDVDASIELGGFVDYRLGPITLSAEARQAVSGHDGFVADLGARWSSRPSWWGQPILLSAGPRVRLVDDRFNQAYFGVTPDQSTASGLPVFDAAGGLHSYGVGATAVLPVGSDWTVVAFAGFDKMSGDAASNPLVLQRGSDEQATVGLFLSWRAL